MRTTTLPGASNSSHPMNIFLCPLTEPGMVNLSTTSSYVMLFDTRAKRSNAVSVVGWGPNRLEQYRIDGTSAGTTGTANSWYYPNIDERKLLRKLGQKWTGTVFQTTQYRTFRLLAGDYVNQRGSPNFTRFTNHPERNQGWGRNGGYFQGPANTYPKTTANYAATDGSVIKYQYSKNQTLGFTKIGEHADSSVGIIPDELRVD
jgi:hypothetical protein